MRKAIFLHIIACILMLLPTLLLAQPQNNGYDTGDGDPDAENVPFDGGLIVLVAVGVGYGIKKVIENSNEGKVAIIAENIKKENII